MNENDRDLILRLEAKIDRLTDKVDVINAKVDDHETRMRSVERWKLSIPISVLLAIATVIGAAVGGR